MAENRSIEWTEQMRNPATSRDKISLADKTDLKNIHPSILLITPPLTQINTPYPATAFLKGFLTERGFQVKQIDIGIELILSLFSRNGLTKLFKEIRHSQVHNLSESIRRVLIMARRYQDTIDEVIRFLQNKDSTLAYRICNEGFLPEGSRFRGLEDLDWAFGSLGIQDRSRLLATCYLEDLSDIIQETVAPEFGFSRYAEKLSLSAVSFKPIEEALENEDSFIDKRVHEIMERHILNTKPDIIGITVPFPGCLYGALKCSRIIKKKLPLVKIVLGGGYINTELRELVDPGIFKYVDYITVDNGENPFLQVIRLIQGQGERENLQRTYLLADERVLFINDKSNEDIPFSEIGTPDYSDLPLDRYLSILEIANPMHRLWSDGRWNKITVARGCYWQKCAFCDTSLDYIKNYNTIPAEQLVDRLEKIIQQTGQTGFHFVDEAAPPKILKEVALEILKRGITITWWSNIRFERNYTEDVCELLAASGCVAVSGGLETASDRLLKKMNKGITIRQAAVTLENFRKAGILVHSYLMYGFPSQTTRETIDSLEIVRQFFLNGLIHSCFWHRFSLTAHSQISKHPEKYSLKITGPEKGGFAWNDLIHEDATGCDHGRYKDGLNKAVYNYMYGVGLEADPSFWFKEKTVATTIPADFIHQAKAGKKKTAIHDSNRIVWLGTIPDQFPSRKNEKSGDKKNIELIFYKTGEIFKIELNKNLAAWISKMLEKTNVHNHGTMTFHDLKIDYQDKIDRDFRSLQNSRIWKKLRKNGLLIV